MLYERQLVILRLLRGATKQGVVTWSQNEEDQDCYFTVSGPLETFIRYKWVTFNGDEGSDRDFVEIGVAGHHMAGTQGWWLATEILAAGDVDFWRNHNEQICERYDATIAILKSHTSDSST